uniref:PaREP6 n=1 Tax=Ignisphaera aggregans TaxID=334771 RepID=A0A7C5XNZ4_9CREN
MNENILKEWVERFREAREIRRRYANWEFIKSQPPRIRVALEYYIETGDFRTAAKIADMGVDEFVYMAKDLANIPTVD